MFIASNAAKGELAYRCMRDYLSSMKYPEPVTTNEGRACTLKEMAALQSTENDVVRPHVSMMCTMEYSIAECHQSYKKLSDFIKEGSGQCKCELIQILYPTFVSIYLDLIAKGVSAVAASFYSNFVDKLDSPNQEELRELSGVVTMNDLASSPLADKFRNHRYHIKMSDTAFHCLMHFLQTCKSSLLLTVMQEHIAIEVCRCTSTGSYDPPATTTTVGDVKLPSCKRKRTALKSESDSTGVSASGSDGAMATPVDELRKRLKDASDNFSPSAPSLRIYSINTHGSQSMTSSCFHGETFVCGFDNSSIHTWRNRPTTTSSKRIQINKSYSYLSLDDHNNDNHSGISMDRSTHCILRGHTGPVYSTCFTDGGCYLLSASEDTTVRLWNMQDMECLVSYRGHNYPVWGVSSSPIGIYFASCSHDNTARLWSSDTLYPLRVFVGHLSGVDVCSFHPNGNYLATGSCDRTCRLWDIQSGNSVRVFTGSKGAINTLAFSPSGKQLAAAGEDGIIHIWDIASCDTMVTHKGHEDAILGIAYSPCGKLLASCSHDNTIRVWDTNTSQSVTCFDTENDTVHHLNFTHKNNLVAMANYSAE